MFTTEEKKRTLQNTKLFSAVADSALTQVAAALKVVTIPAGETFIHKGDMGTTMYVIVAGYVRVHDGDLMFNYLHQGDVVGEMSVLDHDVRSASVTAETDITLFQLEQQALYEVMADQVDVTREIIHVLCQRLRGRIQDWAADYQQRRTLERELEIGREIQASFLPSQLPQDPNWEIAACFQAAQEVAGDFYDAFALPQERKVGLVIGDVCGKGVGAALFMTLFRSLVRAMTTAEHYLGQDQTLAVDDFTRLQNSLTLTNNYIAQTHGQTSMFASLFLALLNLDTGVLYYINGGHEAPIIFNQHGVKAYLERTSPAIGLFPNMRYQIQEAVLEPGDTLLAFTDGVTEAKNSQGELFTEERLLSLLGGSDVTASALLERIEQQLFAYIADASRSDDITMLVVKRRVGS